MLTDVGLVMEYWRSYCAELYNTEEPTNIAIAWSTKEADILSSEIEHAIKALNHKRSPSKDGITVEILKRVV